MKHIFYQLVMDSKRFFQRYKSAEEAIQAGQYAIDMEQFANVRVIKVTEITEEVEALKPTPLYKLFDLED